MQVSSLHGVSIQGMHWGVIRVCIESAQRDCASEACVGSAAPQGVQVDYVFSKGVTTQCMHKRRSSKHARLIFQSYQREAQVTYSDENPDAYTARGHVKISVDTKCSCLCISRYDAYTE